MNLILDEVWDEKVHRLAVGLRLVDAVRGGRPINDVTVALEDVPRPHPIPRPGPLGADPGIGLATLALRRSGRFALLYRRADQPATFRVFHRDRRYAPRRLRIPVPLLADVEAEDAASRLPPFAPVRPRGRAVALFPGGTYPVSGVTGLRTRLVRPDGTPVPWGRVWATSPGLDRVEGIGHADDRGEFVLLLRSTNLLLAAEPSLERTLVLHAALPPVGPPHSPGDPARDPLASLPVEDVPAPGVVDPVSPGEEPPAGYATSPKTMSAVCRMGRITVLPPFTV